MKCNNNKKIYSEAAVTLFLWSVVFSSGAGLGCFRLGVTHPPYPPCLRFPSCVWKDAAWSGTLHEQGWGIFPPPPPPHIEEQVLACAGMC